MAETAPKTGGILALVVVENWHTILSFLLVTISTIVIAAITLDVRRQGQEQEPPAGCRRLGLPPGKSNLRDQYDPKYAKGSDKDKSSWKVKALSIYPVKSCFPVELDSGEVIPTGMKYDRQFTFAQLISSVAKDGSWEINHQWSFVTQRQSPHLTKVTTELWVPDPSSPTYSPNGEWVKNEGCIVISFPYMEDKLWISDRLERLGAFIRKNILMQTHLDYDGPRVCFRIPFNPTPERIKEKAYPREPMKIWDECPEALNMGVEIPEEILAKLKYALGISNQLTLFRVDPLRFREVYRCAPRKGQEVEYQPVVGMADAYPLHIINLASVHDVASRLPKPTRLDAIRFRANIYVTGPPTYAEDHWRVVRIGSRRYHVSCRTARCTMINVNPATAERERNEPYKSMSEYRKIDSGAAKWPCLGMQMVPMSGDEGEIRVGDEIVVEEVGEHCYIPQGPS
ncbi:Mitochondrial amidoxime-reducing component 1 [Lasiodiplodia theobromae]|uniref:Mitochondrial amidoxime-reducing component 1 n=1 Tax=Lasiodiplodia theobromae TaxID=45133 RepID=A0A5N5DTF0_9PEZI|nr:Mitochondrial amidoxime-reducing component 1 [Lasiodiplodia theobromae]